jgi:hypothetical protein
MIQKFLCSALLAATTFASVYASAPQYAPWFINVAGGGSAFIGTPKGCEDLFGRVQPTLQVSLGLSSSTSMRLHELPSNMA